MCESQIPDGNMLQCILNRDDGDVWASARSRHVEGVNASHCDGSVKFYNNDVNLQLWKMLATKAGGEISEVLPSYTLPPF